MDSIQQVIREQLPPLVKARSLTLWQRFAGWHISHCLVAALSSARVVFLVMILGYITTPADTVAARSAAAVAVTSGWSAISNTYYRVPTAKWSSLSRMRLILCGCTTPAGLQRCCSSVPARCSNASPETLNTSEQKPVLVSPCTHGAAICRCIRTFMR